jgi:hypothetical protein
MALVIPVVGQAVVVVTGGVAVQVFPAGIAGGFIFNGNAESDQGISPTENLYVNPINSFTTLEGNGSTFIIYPGATWIAIPGQNTPTWVNAGTSGHKFTAIYWL